MKLQPNQEILLQPAVPRYAGYCDCFLSTPFFLRLENKSAENVVVRVKSEESELFLPFEQEAEIPFESEAALRADGMFSPRFLAENGKEREFLFRADAFCGEENVASGEAGITALPFDFWEGLNGIAEKAACFVRPRAYPASRVLKEAKRRFSKWGAGAFEGYANADRTAVKKAAFAIFSAIREFGFVDGGTFDLTRPVLAAPPSPAAARKLSGFRLALFAAACLERAGLNAALALGGDCVGVGVWLFDSCFLESSSDDSKTVEKYLAEGVNHLAFIDAEDLFSSCNSTFLSSSEKFLRRLKAGRYEKFVDIRRCRMAGFLPCPMRGEGESGYEIYEEKENNAPPPVREYAPVAAETLPKNKLWERGLLDFSSRNPLLAFKEKNAIRVLAPDADALVSLARAGEMKLKGGGKESDLPQEKELLLLEEKKGILRTALGARETDERAAALKRKNREAVEETGAKILFLACGLLGYGKEGDELRYAPVALFPAELDRAKGKEGFALTLSKECFVNATLLEFLKREYNLDLRGLDRTALSVGEMLGIVRRETACMKGWEVREEIYLSVFSFQRYFMWNDLKSHFKEFEKNRNVRALLSGKTEQTPPMSATGDADALVLPLPSDASQREAAYLSDCGTSFVLHGPPGTGKSQTITNIIALALERGKSVLFVAEKKAAVDVVRRRLEEIGIGDFCLELNSKTDGEETFAKLNRTLLLKEGESANGEDCYKEYLAARRELEEPVAALHEKRKLSLSVYEAIVRSSERKSFPDCVEIGDGFFETLDEEKLAECKKLVLSASAAAKECGGVCNSPFENVNLKEYSPAVRDRALLSAQTLLSEAAHFKCLLVLALGFFKQRIASFTRNKAESFCEIIEGLLSKKYASYFNGISAEEFRAFRSANARLDRCLSYYAERFSVLVNIEKDYEALKDFLDRGGDYRFDRAALSLKKRLEKVALRPLDHEDVPKYLKTIVELFGARKQILSCDLSKNFTDRSGRISEKKRAEYLAPINELCAAASSVFSEWNPELFFDGCIRAENGCAEPLFRSFLAAAEEFFRAEKSYLLATAADGNVIAGEDILGYYTAKAGALLENADLLSGRCAYKAAEEKLNEHGMKFLGDALERGRLTPDNLLGGFEKSLLRRFLSAALSSDPRFSRVSGGENTAEQFRILERRQREFVRSRVRQTLVGRLPEKEEFAEEFSAFYRLSRSGRRGKLRALFANAAPLVKRICPCLLMSPDAAAQYLRAKTDEYDLVIFDEASQMTTAEAIPALARAGQAVIVGDNKQLPPTSFFRTAFSEEDEEGDCLESVLDEALAAGFEERSLLWHYRSRHESLIAFSNAAYYENRLNTFPSPTAGESRVKLVKSGGVYERGGSKRNQKEAEAVVREVIGRLSDPALRSKSIGVVTFSDVQRETIEKILSREIAKHSLEETAYGGKEPLFVKNLENVQGDERDVILFSVCYGFDGTGKLSYNFGPLNRAGGWRRLNVACSRAREEMIVFSSITADDIDLNRTSSEGVAGLKAFLEFSEKGKISLARPAPVSRAAGLGKYLARELSAYGYECRAGVGSSAFKIDVAVLDPADKTRFVLGILTDGEPRSAIDRAALLPAVLKQGEWNLMSVSAVSYFNNPKRELKKIKDRLDVLTGKRGESRLARYAKPYRFAEDTGGRTASFITDGGNDEEIVKRLKIILSAEEPISRPYLKKRCMESFGIVRGGAQAALKLDKLISRCAFSSESVGGTEYFYRNPRSLRTDRFRREGRIKRRRSAEDFTPFETAALIKGILEEKVTLYDDELTALVASVYGVKETDSFAAFVLCALSYGETKGMFVRSGSGRISLA